MSEKTWARVLWAAVGANSCMAFSDAIEGRPIWLVVSVALAVFAARAALSAEEWRDFDAKARERARRW